MSGVMDMAPITAPPVPAPARARVWNPFARRRERVARLEAAAAALERATAATEAERARLAEAVDVAHRALAVLHDRLCDWSEQPARAAVATARLEDIVAAADTHARRLVETARDDLRAAAAGVAADAAERVALELAPARAAAEAHADYLRASLDRMRGEAAALGGAQDAAASLAALSATAQAQLHDALHSLARRTDQAGDVAERAAERLLAVADRLDRPARRAASR